MSPFIPPSVTILIPLKHKEKAAARPPPKAKSQKLSSYFLPRNISTTRS